MKIELAATVGCTHGVSGADKLHNARAIVSDLRSVGPAVFDRFSAGRDDTLWYYRQLAKIFSSRRAPMAKQLDATVAEMEKLAEVAR